MPYSNWHGLQRPDLHYAPLDGAAGGAFVKVAKLEGDRSLRKLAVLDIDGFDTVEHDGQPQALGRDLIGVPFAAAFGIGDTLPTLTMAPVP